MNSLDRTLGILLLLRGGRVVSATDLARRFEVSVRTIYRDLETLSLQGIPVIPEMGRRGGFKLREGFFLPPVAFSVEEATSLVLGVTIMKALRVLPFSKEMDFAERKLLAILPEETRKRLEGVGRFIGFERVPPDFLHPEYDDPITGEADRPEREAEIVGRLLEALLGKKRVRLRYYSPYRGEEQTHELTPEALIWDRDRWYLVGDLEEREGEKRMWRSDRMCELAVIGSASGDGWCDASRLLGRRWLEKPMERWRLNNPVRILLTAEQAQRLKRDWYFGHALFEETGDGKVVMTYGESDASTCLALVRWLGPGAVILDPSEWRHLLIEELEAQAAAQRAAGQHDAADRNTAQRTTST
jgi:predicted DNA-binding transcriptional regulator YafY